MFKPKDYDAAKAYDGTSEAITPGGHVCVILDAREQNSRAGNPMLVLSFDIADGDDFAGYFKRKYNSAKQFNADARWPNSGVYRQLVTKKDGTTDEYFKGLITAIEESNPGFKFGFDEKSLRGKKFGGLFGREQFEANDGTLKWSTRCRYVRSVKALKDAKAPEDKYLNGQKQTQHSANKTAQNDDFLDLSDASDDDLPF